MSPVRRCHVLCQENEWVTSGPEVYAQSAVRHQMSRSTLGRQDAKYALYLEHSLAGTELCSCRSCTVSPSSNSYRPAEALSAGKF